MFAIHWGVITLTSLVTSWHVRFLWLLLAGMFAIRAERDYVIEEDFMKAVRKVSENKKLETKLDYKPV